MPNYLSLFGGLTGSLPSLFAKKNTPSEQYDTMASKPVLRSEPLGSARSLGLSSIPKISTTFKDSSGMLPDPIVNNPTSSAGISNPTDSSGIASQNTDNGDSDNNGLLNSKALMGGLNAAANTFSSLSSIPSTASSTQRGIASANAVVGGVSNALMSSGNPYAMAVGAGIKGIDALGGLFMKNNATSKAIKSFNVNQDVAQSSAYSGTATQAGQTKDDGAAYQKSGMFGKLFGHAGKIKADIINSNWQQNAVSDVLKQARQAFDGQLGSQDMYAAKLQNNLYNSDMWNNGSVVMGKGGAKIHIKKSHEGRFTEYKKRTGKTTEEALHSSDPHVRKMAQFAKNAAAWKHQQGGVMKRDATVMPKPHIAYLDQLTTDRPKLTRDQAVKLTGDKNIPYSFSDWRPLYGGVAIYENSLEDKYDANDGHSVIVKDHKYNMRNNQKVNSIMLDDIVKGAVKSKIDPYLALSIGQRESGLGHSSAKKDNYSNYQYFPTNVFSSWAGDNMGMNADKKKIFMDAQKAHDIDSQAGEIPGYIGDRMKKFVADNTQYPFQAEMNIIKDKTKNGTFIRGYNYGDPDYPNKVAKEREILMAPENARFRQYVDSVAKTVRYQHGGRLQNGGTNAVLNYQRMMNQKYGANITEDGLWGDETEKAFEKFEPEKYNQVMTNKSITTGGRIPDELPKESKPKSSYVSFNPILGGEIPKSNEEKPDYAPGKWSPLTGTPNTGRLMSFLPGLTNPLTGTDGTAMLQPLPKEKGELYSPGRFSPLTGTTLNTARLMDFLPTMRAPLTGNDDTAQLQALPVENKQESKTTQPIKNVAKADSTAKFNQFKEQALSNLKALFPGKRVDIDFHSGGIYNKEGGRDIATQDTLKANGASQTNVSLHNFNAARDYTIYVNGAPVDGKHHLEVYKKVLWDAADKTGVYHLSDWDPGHIGLAKEGVGTAFDELKDKYPELFKGENAKHTIEFLNRNPIKYQRTLQALNGSLPLMYRTKLYQPQGQANYDLRSQEGFKYQHGGKVGIPHPGPQVPKATMPQPGNIPAITSNAQPMASPIGMPMQPLPPKQVVENKGDKAIDEEQMLAIAKQSKNANVNAKPVGALSVSSDIINMINDALQPTPIDPDKLPAFRDGGAINVIVDGSLHAHNHELHNVAHLKDAKITAKGIPVVTMDEGGEVTQHAEVERDELILHFDLTKKLEELMDEGTEEAMIEAGRILSKEIVKNTRDSKSKLLKNG